MLRHTFIKPLSHWTAIVLRVGRKTVLKQSQVIRNFLACVPKWHKVVAKMFNMFKILCDKIPRKIVAKSSRVSRTLRELVVDPAQFSRNHFGTRRICKINKTELRINYDIFIYMRHFATTLGVN